MFHGDCLRSWLSNKFTCPLCNKQMRVKAAVFKNLMRIAKEDKNGRLSKKLQTGIDLMMSKDERNKSYSVEVDVSQLILYDIDDSIHYVSSQSGNGDN